MTAADRPSVTDNARAEAERHYPALNADDEALTYPRSAVREHARGGFVKGYEAGWTAALAAGRAETDDHHTANGLGRLITAATALTIALVPAALWPGTWWAALGLTIGATLIARLAYVAITSKERP